MLTTTELKNLNGEVLKFEDKTLTVGRALAEILLGRNSQPHKAYLLAVKFYQNEEVELDNADLQFVKDAVHSSTMNSLVTGQIIELLNSK